MVIDTYQRRYLEHRERKAEQLAAAPTEVPMKGCELRTDYMWRCPAWDGRRSVRVFRSCPIYPGTWSKLVPAVRNAPQSCNRQALRIKVVKGSQVGDLLAGGEGWLGGAPTVMLIFADMAAYKSPVEREFMPRLDAGVMLATIVYVATADGLGSCIVNPHIRPEHRETFDERFNAEGRLFCGAVALGYAAIIPEAPEKKPMAELVEWVT